MDEFASRLDDIENLSDDDLATLETDLISAFDDADSNGDVELMQQLADALDQVRAEATRREGEAAAPADQSAASAAPAAAPATPATPPTAQAAAAETSGGDDDEAEAEEDPGDEDGEGDGEGDGDGESEDDDAEDEEVEITPSTGTPPPDSDPDTTADELRQRVHPTDETSQDEVPAVTTDAEQEETVEATSADVPQENQPVAAAVAAPIYAITAGGDIPGITAGQQLVGMDEVIDAMTRKVNSMRGVNGDGEQVIVASIRRDLNSEFGEDRILRRGDPDGNAAKIRAFHAENQTVESLVAAGWCAPKTPVYDIPGVGSSATPVADSLASFGADRGGIVWTEPPSIGGLGLNTLGRWMNIGTASSPNWQFVPGTTGTGSPAATKPCFDVPCGAEHTIELMGVPLCLCFDLLMSRAHPELVKATTDLVMVAQARFTEQMILAQMFGAAGVQNFMGATYTPGTGGLSNLIGTPDTPLGAARDFLVTARLAASQMRWRQRLDPTQQLRLYAPAWLRDAIASDLAIQMPGDDKLDVSYGEVDSYLAGFNVSPIWYMDDVPTGVGTQPVGANDAFDSYLGYAANAQWLLTLPGVYTRLDGGSIDLGVVRNRADAQANKFCQFAETFETVAYMGPTTTDYAWAVRGTTPVLIRGGFAPAVASIAAGGVVGE